MGNWKCVSRDIKTYLLINLGTPQLVTKVTLSAADGTPTIGATAMISRISGINYSLIVPFIVTPAGSELLTPLLIKAEGAGWSEMVPLPG